LAGRLLLAEDQADSDACNEKPLIFTTCSSVTPENNPKDKNPKEYIQDDKSGTKLEQLGWWFDKQ
jgi:hypothetical protein